MRRVALLMALLLGGCAEDTTPTYAKAGEPCETWADCEDDHACRPSGSGYACEPVLPCTRGPEFGRNDRECNCLMGEHYSVRSGTLGDEFAGCYDIGGRGDACMFDSGCSQECFETSDGSILRCECMIEAATGGDIGVCEDPR